MLEDDVGDEGFPAGGASVDHPADAGAGLVLFLHGEGRTLLVSMRYFSRCFCSGRRWHPSRDDATGDWIAHWIDIYADLILKEAAEGFEQSALEVDAPALVEQFLKKRKAEHNGDGKK